MLCDELSCFINALASHLLKLAQLLVEDEMICQDSCTCCPQNCLKSSTILADTFGSLRRQRMVHHACVLL